MLKKTIGCPNSECPYHEKKESLIKDGHYFRKNDGRRVQRYKCTHCRRKCSHATFEFEFNQKKRRINRPIFDLLCSLASQRRIARLLGINKNTVARKLKYWGEKSKFVNMKLLAQLPVFECVQMDDLITKENSKLKPLTISGIVTEKSRFILSLEVGKIPAFGHLARKGKKKYGPRENEHEKTLRRAIKKAQNFISAYPTIRSDEHQLYPRVIKENFKDFIHYTYKGGRGCITGQGELKQQKWDPLFSINHTFAMLRANINRLIRKTWCTTKDIDQLQNHLNIYQYYHNLNLR